MPMSALSAHRRRLAERGLKRLEVRATPADAERRMHQIREVDG
jgi:hypothetical protein